MTIFDAITKEQADSAAIKLSEKLKQPSWLTGGVGVGKCRNSYVISVYVDKLNDEVRKKVPMSVDGVPIQLEAIGKVYAKPAT
jgi:hypothetical protein